MLAVDLGRQKELHGDPKAIQEIELVGPIYVCLDNFRKNRRNEIKIFSRKCDSITKDAKLSISES